MQKNVRNKLSSGFTLIELLVVIAVIGLLAGVVLNSVNSARAKARDARRLEDMRQIQIALELYRDKFGQYPQHVQTIMPGLPIGYDIDASPSGGSRDFIAVLTTEGFLPQQILDPFESGGNYFYRRYTSHSQGSSSCTGPFYVLGVRNMDTATDTHPLSPEWNCGVGITTWTVGANSFEWVAGSYE